MRNVLLIISALFIFNGALAQRATSFSEKNDQFLLDLDEFFQTSKSVQDEQKKQAKELIEQFSIYWASSDISSDEKKAAIQIANLMLDRKMKPFPEFKEFLSTLQIITKSNQSQESFQSWVTSLKGLTKKNKDFLTYLLISQKLLTNNTLYESISTKWKTNTSDFHFAYDTIPMIVFGQVNLTCYANNDSSVLYNTTGIYYPTELEWKGKGGTVYWERAGFSHDSVYAQLKKYAIKISSYNYKADSVTFYNKTYFSAPLLGSLEEKVLAALVTDSEKEQDEISEKNEENATYPRFNSYEKKFVIKDIFKDVDYEGGFAMHGRKFIGFGDLKNKAKLYFSKGDTLFVVASALRFSIRPDRISTQHAQVNIYYKNDSIYHPDLVCKYIDSERKLSLIRTDEGVSQSPFFNTYHMLDMDVEAIY